MIIEKIYNGTELTLKVIGRINDDTASGLEAEIKYGIDGNDKLILDFKELKYISHEGLRVILQSQQEIGEEGKMIIKNVSPTIKEIFGIMDMLSKLTIE